MRDNTYLRWMTENTKTMWCNDSGITEDIKAAINSGATGCTSNPPLTWQALTDTPEVFEEELKKIPAHITGDEKAVQLIGVVVRHISAMLYDMFEKSGGEFGYIRAQVQPDLSADGEAMLAMGKTFASWARNIMVKIPGTAAGLWVLEELAALGIPTNPTVCPTVSQMVAVAKAYEAGIRRAEIAGIKPAPSTAAVVIGRLQDYLTVLNDERNAGLSIDDLECAALAVAKRSYRIYIEKGYKQLIMPAAFRSARQVEQLVGARMVMTIHPKIQDEVILADAAGTIKRNTAIDEPIDEEVLKRVSKALPEFTLAYEPDALSPKDFDVYGATVMTLDGFDVTGWQKLKAF